MQSGLQQPISRSGALPRNKSQNDGNKYEGRSINKLQNGAIPLILKIGNIRNVHFVENLIGDIYWKFCDDDVITVAHLYLERSQSVQYFVQQFSFATRKC